MNTFLPENYLNEEGSGSVSDHTDSAVLLDPLRELDGCGSATNTALFDKNNAMTTIHLNPSNKTGLEKKSNIDQCDLEEQEGFNLTSESDSITTSCSLVLEDLNKSVEKAVHSSEMRCANDDSLVTEHQGSREVTSDEKSHVVDNENPFPCVTCGERFSELSEWVLHLNVHAKTSALEKISVKDEKVVPIEAVDAAGKRLHICSVCNKEFSSRRVLHKHEKIHSNVRVHVPSTRSTRRSVSPDGNLPIKHENNSQEIVNIQKTPPGPACDVCFKTFSTRKTLNRHRRNIHKIYASMQSNQEPSISDVANSNVSSIIIQDGISKPYCDICKKTFSTRKTLNKHRRNIHSGLKAKFPLNLSINSSVSGSGISENQEDESMLLLKPFVCEICNKRFLRRKNLNSHQKIHTAEKTFKCEWCPKAFHRNGDLKVHKRLHTGEKPYRCDQCPKAFSRVGHFAIHKRVHAGEKPFRCQFCPKTFFRSGNLYSHMKVHTGDKTFKCDFCLLKYATVEELDMHKVIHIGARRYECKVCRKTFSSRSHLTVHKRIHSGDRRFKCDICLKTFYRSDTLVNHLKSHVGKKTFPCAFCPVVLTSEGQLLYHMKTSHSIDQNPIESGIGDDDFLGM